MHCAVEQRNCLMRLTPLRWGSGMPGARRWLTSYPASDAVACAIQLASGASEGILSADAGEAASRITS